MLLRKTVSRWLIVSRVMLMAAIILSLVPYLSNTVYSPTESSNISFALAAGSKELAGSLLSDPIAISEISSLASLDDDDDEQEGDEVESSFDVIGSCLGLPVTLTMNDKGEPISDDNDKIIGTEGPDVINGLGGDDVIKGMDGQDTICGGSGDDELDGGDSFDIIVGDYLIGDANNNNIEGGDDKLYGGKDDATPDALFGDYIEGGKGDDTLTGGDDNLKTGNGIDELYGDYIVGSGTLTGGDDKLEAGDGDDIVLYGDHIESDPESTITAGDDKIEGGDGSDIIRGDDIFGGIVLGGDDKLNGGKGDDSLNGNEGNDELDCGPGTDTADGGTGTDSSHDCEVVGDDEEPTNEPPKASEPVAEAQSVTTDEDTSTDIKLEGKDRDGDEISFSIVENPQHGALAALNPLTGDVSYEPLRDYYGPDSFSFKVNDGTTDSEPATVTIDVIAVNDPPVAHESQMRTREDVPLSLTLSASDPDNDPLTYVISVAPVHGALTGTIPNLQYKPHIHFDGSDSITFKVNDGTVDSNEAKLIITVSPQREHRERTNDVKHSVPAITVPPEEPVSLSNSTNNSTTIEGPLNEIQAPATVIDSSLSIVAGMLGNTAVGPTNVEANVAAEFLAVDMLAPRLLLPTSPLAVLATSGEGALVTYSVQAVDDEDGDITPSCSPSSGSFFPVGRVNVLCKATDAAGNTSLKSFIVVVRQGSSEETGLSYLLLTMVAGVAAAIYGGFRIIKRIRN